MRAFVPDPLSPFEDLGLRSEDYEPVRRASRAPGWEVVKEVKLLVLADRLLRGPPTEAVRILKISVFSRSKPEAGEQLELGFP